MLHFCINLDFLAACQCGANGSMLTIVALVCIELTMRLVATLNVRLSLSWSAVTLCT